jgi:hypothetical protein
MAVIEIKLPLTIPIGYTGELVQYDWCIDNNIFVIYNIDWRGGVTFHFDNEVDATMFTLKWA